MVRGYPALRLDYLWSRGVHHMCLCKQKQALRDIHVFPRAHGVIDVYLDIPHLGGGLYLQEKMSWLRLVCVEQAEGAADRHCRIRSVSYQLSSSVLGNVADVLDWAVGNIGWNWHRSWDLGGSQLGGLDLPAYEVAGDQVCEN